MGVDELLDMLQAVSAMHKNCQEVFCTTCGGKAAAIFRARHEYVKPIDEALSHASVSDLYLLRHWLPVLIEVSPRAVASALTRGAQQVGPKDIASLDKFILLASKYKNCSPSFRDDFQQSLLVAQNVAIDTKDVSLVETLVLVMGIDLLAIPNLLSVSLALRNDPGVARALYNKLREHLPEVRSFQNSWI